MQFCAAVRERRRAGRASMSLARSVVATTAIAAVMVTAIGAQTAGVTDTA